jgi:serine/threonine protein kinase
MQNYETKKLIIDGKYEIIDKLRNGTSYSNPDDKFFHSDSIYLVMDIENESKYILKKNKDKNEFEKELNNYKYIEKNNPSEFLIKFIDSNGINEKNLFHYIILEYAENGNLFSYIENQGGFEEIYCKLIFEQILYGMRDLHGAGLYHGNLKFTNILLNEGYKIKLSNFVYSDINTKKFDNKNKKFGDDKYKSPEALRGSFDGIKNDIYNLGIILIELATGKIYYKWKEYYDKFFKIKHFDLFWKLVEYQLNKNLSKELKDLILEMISFSPEKRPSINEILDSEWMQEIKVGEKEREKLDEELKNVLDKRKLKAIEIKTSPIRDVKINYNIEEKGKSKIKELDGYNYKIYFNKNKQGIKETKRTFALNDVIRINLNVNPFDLMNELCNNINKHFVNCIIKESDKSLKFEVIIRQNIENEEDEFFKKLDDLTLKEKENQDENEEDEVEEGENSYTFCHIDVKLFKYKNECYLIRFVRKSNDIPIYKKNLEIIDSFI